MLRRRKFSRVETIIVWIFATALLGAGLAALVLAVDRADWKVALAGIGVLALGTVYLLAAKRGRPI